MGRPISGSEGPKQHKIPDYILVAGIFVVMFVIMTVTAVLVI